MTIDGDDDLQGLRRAGRAVADARDAMLVAAAPGVTTADLDAVGRSVLRRHGARSAPQLAVGFPAATCVSVNDEAAHGVPSPARGLRSGDRFVHRSIQGGDPPRSEASKYKLFSTELSKRLADAQMDIGGPRTQLRVGTDEAPMAGSAATSRS